jgi:hypothetical protein
MQNPPPNAPLYDLTANDSWDRAYRIPETSDIIVNATSIGLFPHVEGRLDLDLDRLRPGLVVADVIPNPPHPKRQSFSETTHVVQERSVSSAIRLIGKSAKPGKIEQR